jgi:ABC-2 type transport system ATP-binding protein
VEAVRGGDLRVRQGEVFGFLGPNGAGKSTTVRMLTTLMKITSGSARVARVDVAADPDAARKRIGVALQEAGLDPRQTGRELVILQGRLFGMSRISVFGGPTGVGHHVFQDGLDQAEAEAAWGSWLERIFS